jgi:hypothetical protein
MNDQQLLERAAKAAGVDLRNCISPFGGYDTKDGFYTLNMDGSSVTWRWNPLTDDGDALRLAVKLRVQFTIYTDGVESPELNEGESFGSDPYAATRRAIVRAAAAMGEACQK